MLRWAHYIAEGISAGIQVCYSKVKLLNGPGFVREKASVTSDCKGLLSYSQSHFPEPQTSAASCTVSPCKYIKEAPFVG